MTDQEAKKYACTLIGAYDTPDGGDYERHVVRVARRWLRFLGSPSPRQGIVNSILEDLANRPSKAEYGMAWDDLKRRFIEWGVETEWVDPQTLRKLGLG